MPLDPSIPLQVQTPQVNPVNALAQVMAIKGERQQQQMRGLQITAEQQKIDEANAAREDSRALTEAIRANTKAGPDGAPMVDYNGVTGQLAKTGRGGTVLKWLDDVSKRDEQDFKTVQEKLKATSMAGDVAARNFQLVNDQPSWDAAKVLTKKHLEGIHPGMGAIVDQLPAEYSDQAKQAAMSAGMGAKDLNEHLLKLAEDARKAPGEVADADKKVRENAASKLGAATSQAEYTKAWDALPAGVAKMFPSPESWNKETTPVHVRQVGMAPNQQSAAEYRNRLIKVDEGNLRARELELSIRQNEASAKDPAQTQDWREYTKADDDNWKNYQQAVKDASRNLKDPPKYTPLGTFADWRAKKYGPGGVPAPATRQPAAPARPAAPAAPAPAASHSSPTTNLPAPKQGAIHLKVGARLLEFDTIAQRDKFLKDAGLTLSKE